LYVHNTRTYVSLLRLCFKTRMLRTFIAKASSTVCVLSPQERHCIEALTCKLKMRFQLANEQRPPEKWQMTWKRHLPSPTTCCHMINKKKLVSSHHSSPQTWQSLPPKVFQMYLWWRHCCHTFEIINFLSLSDSKKVCMGVTVSKLLPTLWTATSNNPWVLTCLYVMKTLNKNWCWLTLWSKCTHLFEKNFKDIHRHNHHQQNKEVAHLIHWYDDHWLNIFCSKERWIELNKGSVFQFHLKKKNE
jgi:hypothetical protein